MRSAKHIVIVAGEESGDLHAAAFVSALKKNHESLRFTGIGGHHMQKAGVELLSSLAQYGVTGISEVIRHISVIRQAFSDLKAHLTTHKPDLLILVDYPGFNLRIAKFAKKLGIRILYYISPQIWAWKPGRIKTIQACVDKMAVIFPFEKQLYERAGVPVSFVGHPLIHNLSASQNEEAMRDQLKLPKDKKLIALLPGSRINEILRHMPVLQKTAEMLTQQFNDLHFVIPVADTIDPELIIPYFKDRRINHTIVLGQAVETMSCSDFVVVASGTASLECALLAKPMCIIYKASLFTYIAATKLIKVKYIGLCNLLQNQMVVPELLQYDLNPLELTKTIKRLLTNEAESKRMQYRLNRLRQSLSLEQADKTIASVIEEEIERLV